MKKTLSRALLHAETLKGEAQLLRDCRKALTRLRGVFARREEQREKAAEAGARSAPFEELTDLLPSFDLVFNTVPAHVIGEGQACLFQKSALYVELASAPYGMSENSRGRLPCRHLFALGLPGKYAPLYAGGLIAKRVLAALGAAQKEEKDRGDGR